MEQLPNSDRLERDIRHFIYTTFAETTFPPTTLEMAKQLKIPKAVVEEALDRLAQEHQIALAPGSHSIWMAHPFSALRTDYTAVIGAKKYHGN